MTQKLHGVFVTGTDTAVGKTWVGQAIIRELNSRSVTVVPRKPVESGWQQETHKTDAGLLARTACCEYQLEQVCPNRLEAAVSPVRAAALEGKTLLLEEVMQQCLEGILEGEFLYVEGAGGFFSPFVSDGLNADFAKALDLPVLLVARDSLGCINHTLLTLAAIKYYGLVVKGIILNSSEQVPGDTQMNNFEDLVGLVDVPIYPFLYQQDETPSGLVEALLS